MSIKKLIKELRAEAVYIDICNHSEISAGVLLDAAAALESMSWISVDECYPPYDVNVLVMWDVEGVEDMEIDHFTYDSDTGTGYFANNQENPPTHFLVPPAYKD